MQQEHNTESTLSIVNENPINIEGPNLLHELVSPISDALALDFLENGSRRLEFSYEALHTLSDAFAGRIIKTLAELEEVPAIIPVLLPQSPELYITLLAILKAGKAFCPISLDSPAERVDFILRDISGSLLITKSHVINKFELNTTLTTILVDRDFDWTPSVVNYTTPETSTDDLAYVLYTSGSTGVPKGVGISHRAVTQSLLAHNHHIPDFTRFLQFAAPTFDVSIFEIFFPWYRGSTVVGCERTRMLNDLPGTIQILGADAAELTPTVVSNLLKGRSSVPGLELLLTIGEMLTESIVTEYGATDTRKGILWGMYGPTEAAIHCTLQPNFDASSSTSTIGLPLRTVSAFIAATASQDNVPYTLRIVPRGEEGELVVGGRQIAERYLNRPESTASSFIHHHQYGYLYRTGDRARIRFDGTLECLGRIATGQVKLRGQRVELGEIEQIIMKVDACRAATVMVIERSLVAFCASSSTELLQEDILNICKRWLPAFMLPSEVVIMQSMPQLSSGKIDRTTLEALYRQKLHDEEMGTPNVDISSGHVVQCLLEEQLKRTITSDANLVSAGLDSLQSIHIASALRRHGYKISAVDVSSAITIRELIQMCENNVQESDTRQQHDSVPLSISKYEFSELKQWHEDISHTQPCTPLQEAMLAETIARPGAYCNWLEVELSEIYTIDDILAAIYALADSNEILRSGFYTSFSDARALVQVVWNALAPSQVLEVETFSKMYSLGSHDSLLRPLTIQIQICAPSLPRLLFQVHHALYDGWSFDLLLEDLEDLLHGRRNRDRPQFLEVVQYYHRLDASQRDKDKEYWTRLLSGRIETALPNYNGKVIEHTSTCSLTGRSAISLDLLLSRSRELNSSPQVFFQAATAFVLSLYNNSTDVVVGNVTSGRTIPVTGIESIMGPCVLSLPFRLRFADLVTVRDVLCETQRLNVSNLQHSSLPLRDIARALEVPAGRRLFDVLFVWQQSLASSSDNPPGAYVIDSADDLEFNITLEYEPRRDYVSFRITYESSIIPEKQIKYLSRQIDEVVSMFLHDMDRATLDIMQCFSTESLSISNPWPRQLPISYGPSHAVEKWASVTPDKKAIVVGHTIRNKIEIKEAVTYDVLNRRSNQLAHVLLARGVTPDSLVGVIMEKSVDLYIAILAVLKTGSGYLPLVPDLPIERTRTIFSDAAVTICISDTSTSAHLCRGDTSASIIDVSALDLSTYPDENLDVPYDGTRLAYAIFTSGSTGVPKGVLVTQDNLMSNLNYLSSIYPRSFNSRLLQACSQAFDVSVFEIFFTWHVGICLCTARKDDLFQDLEEAVNSLGVTHLSLTPTVAALVDPDHVPNVEFLVTAGEAVTEYVRRKWAGRGLWQGYGPSETTNICTIRSEVSLTDLINNIGQAFSNTSTFVLDPDSDTVLPRGATGELCFGGFQVFRGYLNRPELNATKIINHPSYGRIYRSGDMGILLADDCILSTGRLDDQVKIRGQRVELGEITSALLDQEAVHDCATLLLNNDELPEKLISFWVPVVNSSQEIEHLSTGSSRAATSALFSALAQRLPPYMMPSHLVPVPKLPVTLQGKIDKRRLQACFDSLTTEDFDQTSNVFDGCSQAEASNEWEKEVARVLAESVENLSAESIKRNSSFYGLGLDSISAIRFSNGLRKADLGNFAISTILKYPTIERLATAQEICKSTQHPFPSSKHVQEVFDPAELSRIREGFDDRNVRYSKILPCTPLQEAMLSSRQASASTSYSNVMIFDVIGDLPRLQDCWAVMVQRHPILRTAFVATDDPSYSFAQVVLEDTDVHWGRFDAQKDFSGICQTMISNLLEAGKPPLWLAVTDSGSPKKLLFCCHHALYDGTAIKNLLKEVEEAYRDRNLPSLVPYELYLQYVTSQNLTEADRFWSEALQSFEPTYFPDVTGKSLKASLRSASCERRLQTPLQDIREACRYTEISMLSLVQATWAKLLYFYTGEKDICFGNIVSGRNLAADDLGRLVAPCFNTIPVRIKFDPLKENRALLEDVHTFNVRSFDYQLTPLRRIQNNVLKDGGRLFDTLVILQQPAEKLDDQIWKLEKDLGDMDLPLVCEISQDETDNALKVLLHYHNTIMSEPEAHIIVHTFETTLLSMVRRPNARAIDTSDLPLKLQAGQNMGFTPFATDACLLHTQFERNALSKPDQIALDFLHVDGTKTTWSFKTLNEHANRVSHMLIQHGAKVEDIVPIHVSKSPLFYACVLGILKSGAAFCPIHPDLPESRKVFMLRDLGAKFILCTEDTLAMDGLDNTTILNVTTISGGDFTINPHVEQLNESNLAYCLFTSGSTGKPKAVSMEHRSPLQTIESSRSLVPWNNSSRLLQYAATTFDMCYYDCFLAWTFGFALCAAEQQMMLNELPLVINKLEVDLLDLTPSVAASISRSEVPKVKWLYCIGEAMSAEVVDEWEGACVNSYGPTEAAFCTTICPIAKSTKTAIIGRPFPSTSFAVLPLDGDWPLPILSTGELLIGGAQLAREYLGRADLTNERFLSRCGQRFYRSGDFVRMLSDGNFEFIGRADDQVKIRGLRVELGEINHTLRDSNPGVASVVTQILKKDKDAKEQLVAFIATSRQVNVSEQEDIRRDLRQSAKDCLPLYMVPQFFIFVTKIPRSSAGKIDRIALTGILNKSVESNGMANGCNENTTAHTWTHVQSEVREVFARLARIPSEEVLPTISIYQLGLDSISAVQIATALRRSGHKVSASDVMRHTTCSDLAAHIERSVKAKPATSPKFDLSGFERTHEEQVLAACNVPAQDVEAIRPCTPLQKGMISQFISKDATVYLNHIRLQLKSNVDLNSLKQAWAKTMSTHAMLRTGFVQIRQKNNPFVMIQYRPHALKLPWTELKDEEPCESSADWLSKVQCSAIHDLHRPVWQMRVVRKDAAVYLDMAILHALFDAQSLQAIFTDVTAAYGGYQLQPRNSLDLVLNDLLQLSKDENKHGEWFWSKLGKQAQPSRFPNISPLKHKPKSSTNCTHHSTLSRYELQEACKASNTTLQAVGLASWLSLLSAYTGEQTVACGLVLSGRNFEAAENAVFPCITTVPIIYTLSHDRKETLSALTALGAEVQQHQHIPLGDIQRMMGHGNEPLFDTIFALQNASSARHTSQLWEIIEENASVEYPMSIELELTDDGLEYRLSFLPHILPEEHAALVLQQLDHMIRCFLGFDNDRENEDQTLYAITPPHEPTLPSNIRLLHTFVEYSAELHPHRTALEFAHSIHGTRRSSQSWTYSELDAKGNKVAQLLIQHGVSPGGLVGVCFEKCPEASFAMLGVLKAGCAFVAIDPSAPAARQAFIVADSEAKIILSMAAQSTGFKDKVEISVLNLDELDLHLLPSSKPALQRQIEPQDRSYCLYTSGTTGTPKGCEITHENAVQALLSFQRLFSGHWNNESRWLQFASFHFDVSVLEQFWSWSVGICVVSAPRDVIFEDLANSINTLGITHIDLTPSLAQLLHPDDVPSLCEGVFITGGESLKQEILDVWGPKSVIYNGYGPTEATIGCTMYPRVPANGKPSNIGQQFDNVGTLVLKPGTDLPVLRGGIGELCVYGKLVGKGYLNREELTAKSFPYLERFKERVYRTGDLVRILHDGTFEFLGRADDQIKLRGQRLEIGEINSVIRQSSKRITDAATLVLRHPKQQKEQLVAFIVVRNWSQSDPQVARDDITAMNNVKEACQERLPPYMVPTHFVPLTSIPLNVNNKADARKLKEIYETLSAGDLQNLSAPSSDKTQAWSSEQEKLRKIIEDELDVGESEVTKDSSFFELGMDSISVIGIARAIKQSGFKDITASVVMKHSTIHRLAKHLSSAGNATLAKNRFLIEAQQAITALQHRHRRSIAQSLAVSTSQLEAIAPCTPLQQGMIAKSLESEDGLYFNTFVFSLSESVNYEKLRSAWDSVHAATQILRTVFVNTEDGHIQAVLRNKTLPWLVESTTKNEAWESGLGRLRTRWWQPNMNRLDQPFQIVHLTAGADQLLVVNIFHGLYDGISIEFIFQAVWDTYNGRKLSTDAPAFQSVLVHGPLRRLERAKQFWKDHISHQNIGSPFSLGEESNVRLLKATRKFDTPQTFEPTRRKLNVTAQAIAQACWLSVIANYGKGTITIGLVVSGRSIDIAGAERVVGPMFNTIPYQHHHRRSETWASIIKRVHHFNVSAHPYQHTALRDIIKWCNIDPRQPVFDNLFVYQVGQQDIEWANNKIWTLQESDTAADYPLAIEVEQDANYKLKVTLVAYGQMFDGHELYELLNRYERTLQEALHNPEAIVTYVWETNGAVHNEKQGGNMITNGHRDLAHFEWTDDALIIREALVELAGAHVEEVGSSTSIFELGLDSIDAIKLASKLKRSNVELPVSGIMRGSTIHGMLQYISRPETKRSNEHDRKEDFFEARKCELKVHLQRQNVDMSSVEMVLPLTPLQEAMVADMIATDFSRYYNFDVMRLNKDTDIDNLRKAWIEVVAASPILRTSFVEVDDAELESSFAQVVRSKPHEFWDQVETETDPQFSTIFEQLRKSALSKSSLEPPFNVLVVKSRDQIHLVLSIAHALYDGSSISLLHADIKRAYYNLLTPRPDYQNLLSEIISDSAPDAANFWEDSLAHAKPSTFPKRAESSTQGAQKSHRYELTSALRLDEILNFAKKSNILTQSLGQTAFAIALAYYTHSLDVTFGAVLSGREDEVTSQLLFPTMNTVAVRTILHGTRRDFLRYTQDTFMSIKQRQHFPLRKALALAGAHGGLFDGLFIYQKNMHDIEDGLRPLYTSVNGHSDVQYPVCVEMEMVQGEMIWRCAVSDEIFDENGVHDLLSRLDAVLQEIIGHPDKLIIDFTSQGISVCGLPSFEETAQEKHTAENASFHGEEREESQARPHTIRAIRETLAAVSGMLGTDITDDMTIFHIGLDSISAIKVTSLLRRKGITLSVGEMLRAGTVNRMACIVDTRTTENAEDAGSSGSSIADILSTVDLAKVLRVVDQKVSPAVDRTAVKVWPVTAGQLYMLSMWLNSRGTNFYAKFDYEMSGIMTFAKIKEAWSSLVAVNPILRSHFVVTGNQLLPVVRVLNTGEATVINILDITGISRSQRNILMKQFATSQPMVYLLVSQKQDGWSLELKIHHALYDGVSLHILMQHLQDLCNGTEAHQPKDTFDELISRHHGVSAIQGRKAFWKQYMKGIEQRRLPQPTSSVTTRTEIFKPRLKSSNHITELARHHGLSVQSLFLAAYARLYTKLTSTPREQDVVIGVYLANRSLPIDGIENAGIPTVNLLPLRVSSPLEQNIIPAAHQIQVDLQKISEGPNAMASLYEIHEWTRIKVDTFVNFLTLPNYEEDQAQVANDGFVKITQSRHWNEERACVRDYDEESFQPADEVELSKLTDENVTKAYLHAIDIEATVRGGALDVGLFAPVDMLSLEDGKTLIKDLMAELESICG